MTVENMDDRFNPEGRRYGTAPTEEQLRRDYAWQDTPPPLRRDEIPAPGAGHGTTRMGEEVSPM